MAREVNEQVLQQIQRIVNGWESLDIQDFLIEVLREHVGVAEVEQIATQLQKDQAEFEEGVLKNFIEDISNSGLDKDAVWTLLDGNHQVREVVYSYAEHILNVDMDEDNTPEPMRASLEAIGHKFNCELLKNW